VTTAEDRAQFMALLSDLEDLQFEAGLNYGSGPRVGEEGPYVERIRVARRAVVAAYDRAASLARAYDATGVTALVVGRDGVVGYVRRSITPGTRLELPLEAALLVGSAPRS